MAKRNIYLGVTVKDIGVKGLSNRKEFMEIVKRIIYDCKKGKISKAVARGRLLLLYRLTYKNKNKNLRMSKKSIGYVRTYISNAMHWINEL